MTRSAKKFFLIVTVVVGASFIAQSAANAGGNSGWGWQKPMNKRMGLFYTSNKNANFNRSSNKTSTNHYYHKPSQATISRPISVPVIVPQHYGVPHQVISSPTSQALPVAPPVASPSQVAPAAVQTPVATPAKTPPAAAGALPFKSTTNTFWQ